MTGVLLVAWKVISAALASLVTIFPKGADPQPYEPPDFNDDGSSEVPKDFEDFAAESIE